MIKTAIFVEGQTELIFVREYLLKMFDYENVWVECYTLFNDNSLNATEYSFSNDAAEYYFQIVNVGNDNAVLSRLLRREQYLWNSGFHKIFAIRDMYSKDYRDVAQNNIIKEGINIQFVEGTRKTINKSAKQPANIHFHFAIMEVEAWILGMKECFTHLDLSLTSTYISNRLNIDLESDPETTHFHPAKIMENIYGLVGRTYSKSKSDINAIMSNLQKEDFVKLSQSDKCQSFKELHQALIAN